MSFTASLANTVLAFFNQYRQLSIYDKASTSDRIKKTFVLLQTSGTVKKWVSLKIDEDTLMLDELGTAPDADEYTAKDYNFSNESGNIWLDSNGPCLIIGLGDIRDGVQGASIDRYTIPAATSEDNGLIIGCTNPLRLRVYCKGAPAVSATVPNSTI